MAPAIRLAFEPTVIRLDLASLTPRHPIAERLKRTRKFRQISASIQEIGLVEPLVVSRIVGDDTRFLLVDGHLRWLALRELNRPDAMCLVSNSAEALTYDSHAAVLAPIQERILIQRALHDGVRQERLSRALLLESEAQRCREASLDRLDPDAAALLRGHQLSADVVDILLLMAPHRQRQASRLMVAAANISASYARVLHAETKSSDLADPSQGKHIFGLDDLAMQQMEIAADSTNRAFVESQRDFSMNVLDLMVVRTFCEQILRQSAVHDHLATHHPGALAMVEQVLADCRAAPARALSGTARALERRNRKASRA